MNKAFATIVCVLIFVTQNFAAIYSIDSIAEAKKSLLALTEQDLAIFDVDDTLIAYKDSLLRPCSTLTLGWLMLKNSSKITPELYNELTSVIFDEAKKDVIEKETPLIIHEMQQKKIKTIALTAATAGAMGHITKFEEARVKELQEFDIDFDHPFPGVVHIDFEEYKTKNNPAFFQGILFSDNFGKARVLLSFLDKVQFHPKKVVFVDDKLKNLVEVEDALTERGIDFVGFHYKGAEKLPCKADRAVFDLQIQTLETEKRWISDEDAKALLEAQKHAG